MFTSDVDKTKYPNIKQKERFKHLVDCDNTNLEEKIYDIK